jgi:hypothetical protein
MSNNASNVFNENQIALIDWLASCPSGVDFVAFSDECDRIANCVARAMGIGRIPLGVIGTGVIALDYAASLVHEFVDARITSANVPGAVEFRKMVTGE